MNSFLGEIKMFAGNYAPRNYSLCNGQILAVNQYSALFSLVGTTYGGDGRTTFGLPDCRGRIAMNQGQGPGLTHRVQGQRFGTEEVTLSSSQLPQHSHPVYVSDQAPTSNDASNAFIAKDTHYIAPNTAGAVQGAMAAGTIQNNVTETEAHPNRMPYLCLNFIICMTGVYPSRN